MPLQSASERDACEQPALLPAAYGDALRDRAPLLAPERREAHPYTGSVTVAAAADGKHESPNPSTPLLGTRVVLVPVKAFGQAKLRLGGALSDDDRKRLVRTMAEQVLRAAEPLPVAVVCDDAEVAQWARGLGALVIWEPGRGLNGAVQEGVERLGAMGALQVTVAHGDLPLAAGLSAIGDFEGITLVPDRVGDGTNVIVVPVGCGFRFFYGPGSFERHRAACARLGLPTRIVPEPGLAFDVDAPADLDWTALLDP
jgi:2-phospho-L-lactate guanylyltransferase